jgi:integrase/recombinase XerD
VAIASPGIQPYEHLVLDFLAYLEFERGLSRNTLEAYRSDLLQFGEWLRRTARDPLALDHPALAEFVSELALGREGKPPAKPATLQRKVACLRSFHRHLRRQGLIEDDPTALLKAPRQSRKLPQVLSRDEVARLLAQPEGSEPPALRDRALLEVMYACGLASTSRAAGRGSSATASSRGCSSTTAAAGSRARGSTRSCSATPPQPGSPAR